MLEASNLGLKFEEGWKEEEKEHFLSQLMLIETSRAGLSVLYDGGGFSDRNRIMQAAIGFAFKEGLIQSGKRFYVFTGDTRPEKIAFDYAYFSTAGPRVAHSLMLPDPYHFSWNDVGVQSYNQVAKEIAENAQKYKDEGKIKKKAFWRGASDQHFTRSDLLEKIADNDLFDVATSSFGDENFVPMSDVGGYSSLIDLPGRGYSARLKYLIHSGRPIIVYPRENWDWASCVLEPGIHYISTLPVIEDVINKSIMCIDNQEISNFYESNLKRISSFFSEETAILSMSNTINTQSE